MKDYFEQAKAPETPATSGNQRTPADQQPANQQQRNTLKRITLALLDENAAGSGKSGFDPYNSTEGTPAVDVWKRSAERR